MCFGDRLLDYGCNSDKMMYAKLCTPSLGKKLGGSLNTLQDLPFTQEQIDESVKRTCKRLIEFDEELQEIKVRNNSCCRLTDQI